MMRSRVSGISRIRVPRACETALPMAAAVGPPVTSPAPSGTSSLVLISSMSISGTSLNLQDRVGFPVERGDAIVETDLFLQHPACRLNDPAFELVDHAVRIDDQAGIGRAPHVMQGDCLVDRKLDDHSGIGGAVLVAGEANAAAAACAAGSARRPFRHAGNFLDHCAGARIGQ